MKNKIKTFNPIRDLKKRLESLPSATPEKSQEQKYPYGSHWNGISNRLRAKKPLCVNCLKFGIIRQAQVIDHIIPKSQGGTDDPSNLQPLCYSCNNAKREADKIKYGGIR